MTEFEAKTVSLLTDISESLAVLSGRKKPYTPSFAELSLTDEERRRASFDDGDTT